MIEIFLKCIIIATIGFLIGRSSKKLPIPNDNGEWLDIKDHPMPANENYIRVFMSDGKEVDSGSPTFNSKGQAVMPYSTPQRLVTHWRHKLQPPRK